MGDLNLNTIRARTVAATTNNEDFLALVSDVDDLCIEVEQLRAALAAEQAHTDRLTSGGYHGRGCPAADATTADEYRRRCTCGWGTVLTVHDVRRRGKDDSDG